VPPLRVAAPPERPLMIFDGTCGFCRRWIGRWQEETGGAVDYRPSQADEVAAAFPEIPRERYVEAVQLIEPDGRVSAGAEAVFRVLDRGGSSHWPLRAYERIPFVAPIAERAYRFVAERRNLTDRVTTWLWGRHVEHPTFHLARWAFLRALGVVYLVAFVSLWFQVLGLLGSGGILPARELMEGVRQYLDAQHVGLVRYYLVPTLSWLSASDRSLVTQCALGAGFGFLLAVDIAPGVCAALAWLLYLSLVTVGRDFMAFQWDNLLLEAGVLAVFLAPWRFRPRVIDERPPSRLVRGLLLWLLFRLMFESGCIKLLSGDPSWRNLTALTVHYQTQPLPTWVGWYAHQLPVWFQELSCAVMFVIEIGTPFLIAAPRRPRVFTAGALIGLQILIALTGNYTFFNWLTIALCLLLLDDATVARLLPTALRSQVEAGARVAPGRPRWRGAVSGAVAVVVVVVSLVPLAGMFGVRQIWMAPAVALDSALSPLRSVNGYGLFAVMTTERREITVQGSDDGVTWRSYPFEYKPGPLDRRPGFVAPYQPRLDWQMWFAALGTAAENPWFSSMCVRLLQGSPQVLALFGPNPFPDHPPRYVRAFTSDYRFTTFAERGATGNWWAATPGPLYLQPTALR
jgi:predicted DCC family thiol-disulfide oxidoreductase YuxK